ncbi:TldD/PmbA family protein [Pyxidicoccus parkwayensis]|uniref:TldD/PmbA family protein n=2 Tax=Pyxidicoccus parkwayensis TaxID=2813578 RepID=A0ABX7PCW4_9BACT|nr:TldD/PmbA family protein [Pyxidicoccus parkwaysis]
MGPHELATGARAVLEDFGARHTAATVELFLSASHRLTLEYEVHAGTFAASHGVALSAAARVWEGERYGFASAPVGSAGDLRPLLDSALQRASIGVRIPIPPAPALDEPLPSWQPDLSVQRMRHQAEHIARTVVPAGVIVQALVLTRRTNASVLLRTGGSESAQSDASEEVFLRCETSRGAVVDAVALPPGEEDTALVPLRHRLAEAIAALEGPVEAANPALPLVLRPPVAAPLVAGLSWLLRGDVVASTPALARAVGKKAFPSVLSVEDDPLHPRGLRRRAKDDEGRPASRVRLIDEGRLQGFLHSGETAARLGAEPNGRGLREGTSPPAPSPFNLFIVPRTDALPAHYTELVARVETFTTMPRPGTVSLIAGGWEVRDGQRVRRVAPMELDLPLMETFRTLQGVGPDLTFFPTADGCGTPTLILPPPRVG